MTPAAPASASYIYNPRLDASRHHARRLIDFLSHTLRV